jgi:hypothetical protein
MERCQVEIEARCNRLPAFADLSFIVWLHVDTAVFTDRLMPGYCVHLTVIGVALECGNRK